MKTSLRIDESKLKLAKKLAGTSTTQETVDRALEVYIEKLRRTSMEKLLGTSFFDETLTTLRKKGAHVSTRR